MAGMRMERLDHLGIVAGVCQEIGLAAYLDALAGPSHQQVSVGTATVAMVLNGLGFSNRRLYLIRLTKPPHKRPRKQNRSHGEGAGRTNCCLCYITDMTIKRMDHVSVVVDDLPAAIAFFTTLGMALEGEMPVEGPWVDRVNGLEGVQVDIVMMRTPDGHGRLELTKFRNPDLVEIEPASAPPNTLGLRSVMFAVEDLDDTVARLRAHGAELIGEVAQYEDLYRLCYMRGPAGIIVALAEELF